MIQFRLLAAFILIAACAGDVPVATPGADVTADPGEPLPGLSPAELARFEAGKVLFSKTYTPEEGLGPLYTENSCNGCHHEPETGGGGGVPDIHATRFVPPDSCDTMQFGGGFVRKEATPLMRPYAPGRKAPPETATEVGRFFSLPLYGSGLIEAIPDSVIVGMADPDDRDGDGISGRVSRLADGRVGRFRRKADRAAIRDLVEAGVRFAIGLTTPEHPDELPFEGGPIPDGVDPAPDPEIDEASIQAIVDFLRFLAPPRRSTGADDADRKAIALGEGVFDEIGCVSCHVSALPTGPNAVAALDRKMVPLYSDLLLHDMGPDLADVCGPGAIPSEIRTEVLFGLRYRERYLHDGRALSMREAIELHDGESAASRAAFNRLSLRSQEALIRFLWSL